MNVINMPAPSLTIAGFTFTDLNKLVVLSGIKGGTATATTLYENGGTAGYQVPVGKKLIIRAADFQASAVGIGFRIAQSDNDCGSSTTTALTNPVYDTIVYSSATTHLFTPFATYLEIAASKYVTIAWGSGSASMTCRVYATLEDV